MHQESDEYRDPCSEDRDIGDFERNLILGASAAFYRHGKPYGKCNPGRCRNEDEYSFRFGARRETISGCPYRHIKDETQYYLDLYAHYKAGFLEQAGGVLDQSVEYLNAMAIIGRTIAELEEERMEEMRKEHGRGK